MHAAAMTQATFPTVMTITREFRKRDATQLTVMHKWPFPKWERWVLTRQGGARQLVLDWTGCRGALSVEFHVKRFGSCRDKVRLTCKTVKLVKRNSVANQRCELEFQLSDALRDDSREIGDWMKIYHINIGWRHMCESLLVPFGISSYDVSKDILPRGWQGRAYELQ